MTIPASLVSPIQDLLAAGKSQREIARLTRVSRGAVARIAHGKSRPNGSSRPSPLAPQLSGPYAKCDGCGGMVQQPCQVCERRRNPVPRIYLPECDVVPGLEIRERDARERQLALAAQKRLRGESPVWGRQAIEDHDGGEDATDEELTNIDREGQ